MKLLLKTIIDFDELHEIGKQVEQMQSFALLAFPSPNAHRPIHLYTLTNNSSPAQGFSVHAFDNNEQKPNYHISKEEHAEMVNAALKQITSGQLKKVVISRTKEITTNKTMHEWLHVYGNICMAHASAMVYWFKHEDSMWMGATPELLLKKNDTHYETVSLAGTLLHDINTPLAQITWAEKDKREQQLVTEYIVEKLHTAGAFDVQCNGPFTSAAGHLVHLKTTIHFQYTGLVENLLEALHPTPAVCGMPLATAKKFIEQHEPQARSFYTGYLGALNENNQAEYYVNLRCMKIDDDKVTLYAGGGIVHGSVAAQEWEETERKMDTLLAHIRS